MSETALIALGSNQALRGQSPELIVRSATDAILDWFCADQQDVASRVLMSPLYRSPSFPPGSGPDFVNAVMVVPVTRSGDDLLAGLRRIEASFDRARPHRWAPRTLDLDLLALGGRVAPDATTQRHWMDLPPEAQARDTPTSLILPHPRIQDRAFVLVPLCAVAPQWRHPVLGLTATQMHDALPASERQAVAPL